MAGRFNLVIFDLDGTLVDTLDDLTASVNHAARLAGITPFDRETVRRFVGEGVETLVRRALSARGMDAPPERLLVSMIEAFQDHYSEHLLDRTRLYDDARGLLERIPVAKAVLSNKPTGYTRRILEALGIASHFLAVEGGDTVPERKPGTGGLMKILSITRKGPAGAVLVGDSPVDIEAAGRAGIFSVAVTRGFADEEDIMKAGPDLVLADLSGLPDQLDLK